MKPFESILEICVCKYFFPHICLEIVELFPYTCNPTAMLKLLCHAEYVWVANFSMPAQIWALFSIQIDFKGELTYSKHAGIDILHTSLQCWSRLNSQYLLYSWTAVWSRVSINKSARCIFLTLGSHGKICFKLGMDTISKIRLGLRIMFCSCIFSSSIKPLLKIVEDFAELEHWR